MLNVDRMELQGTSRKGLRDRGMMGLSPENWERIMLTLSPEDFQTAINTTREWNQLMTPKKNDVLFPKILPMLIVYLPRETILTCRRLGESVKNRTDELLSNDDDFEETLTDGTKIARFISLMESRPFPERNPFVGRSLVTGFFKGLLPEQTNRKVEAVRQVLARYGHHVEKFVFMELTILFGMVELYVSLLRLLPNLKSITIFDSQFYDMSYNDLKSLNFPKLEKFKELRLELEILSKRFWDTSFCLHFLDEYGHQFKSLALGKWFIYHLRYYSRSFDSLASNLQRFEIDCSMNSDAMEKLAAVTTWELEELHLSFYYGQKFDLPDLLAAVNNFANTLLSLGLMWNLGEGHNLAENRSKQVKYVLLPKLKILSLRFVALKVDWIWDFLKRSCKQLKTLCLKVEDEGEIKTAEETGLLMMYVRHLFCILPMLSKIVINSTSEERVIFRNPGIGM